MYEFYMCLCVSWSGLVYARFSVHPSMIACTVERVWMEQGVPLEMCITWISHGKIHIYPFFPPLVETAKWSWYVRMEHRLILSQPELLSYLRVNVSSQIIILSLTALKSSAGMYPCCLSAAVHHTVPALHQLLMPWASVSYWVYVIWEIPQSTATQLSDADKSCHLHSIIQGRMRTPTLQLITQTNKHADLMKRRAMLHPAACPHNLLKSSSRAKSAQSQSVCQQQQRGGREAPCPLQASRRQAEGT